MTLEIDSENNEVATYRNGENPLELFIQGNTEMRGEIILNHPDLIGFIYLNDGVITKAFLLRKMVNFRTNIKVIISASGDIEDFTTISVHDKALFSSSLHFIDSGNFSTESTIIPIGKHLKDDAENLTNILSEFSTEAKIKKLRIIASPLIIPLVGGYVLPEGDIDDVETYDTFYKVHEVYADWVFLFSENTPLTEIFPRRK